MPRNHAPYAEEFRRRMVKLVRFRGNPEELAKEFEPSEQSIGNWVCRADWTKVAVATV